jgi:hypothetical protein
MHSAPLAFPAIPFKSQQSISITQAFQVVTLGLGQDCFPVLTIISGSTGAPFFSLTSQIIHMKPSAVTGLA